MKFQFNFFGILLFISVFLVLSSLGIFVNNSQNQDDTNSQMSNVITFDNNTQNGTDTNQTEPDDDENNTCETGWRPPIANKTDFKAGSTIPIKFNYCSNGTFVADENVTVVVNDFNGTEVINFTVAKNPHLGIAIQGSTQYHVNWKTPKGADGNYTIIATFSDGFELIKEITLF